jgi:hypothetical protein
LSNAFGAGNDAERKSASQACTRSASGPRWRRALNMCSTVAEPTIRLPKYPAIPHMSGRIQDVSEDRFHAIEHSIDAKALNCASAPGQ